MLGKSSVLMILLVGTGSLVGISSMYRIFPTDLERADTTPIEQILPQMVKKITF
jgi:hypothetical protein